MLMISSLAAAGLTGLHLDLGHVGVYRALAHGAGIANEEGDLFVAMAAKDVPAVAELCRKLPSAWRNALTALPSLYGPAQEVLAQARNTLPDTPAIANALGTLDALAETVGASVEALHIDLADLRGYHYHNGAIFSVFTAGEASAIGNGGRYDGIGKAFGRSRPATGFTFYLRQLDAVLARE
jgi:ATP phosphoribosyltransferase regulatory subunit